MYRKLWKYLQKAIYHLFAIHLCIYKQQADTANLIINDVNQIKFSNKTVS